MIKVLFLIPNLGHGGAEKVLVNLVNHMDREKFEITVMALYDEGVNRASLAPHIEYRACFKRSFTGVSHLLKLLSPEQLYKRLIQEHYDIVVSYLEGQTARIVSGCTDPKTIKICWIHRTMTSMRDSARLFRGESEAKHCYSAFDKIVSVSKDVQNAFMNLYHLDDKGIVLYNTNETDQILTMANESVELDIFSENQIKLCAMGTLIPVKGFDRLIRVHDRLRKDGFPVHTYILGEGPEEKKLKSLAVSLGHEKTVSFLGYHTNPYKYMKQCDLLVCSSFAEGFSTAATEALIVGTPVCTVEVSGMKEMLGENNEYGVVTQNNEDDLYDGLRHLLCDRRLLAHYKIQAKVRGEKFNTYSTVHVVENAFLRLLRHE